MSERVVERLIDKIDQDYTVIEDVTDDDLKNAAEFILANFTTKPAEKTHKQRIAAELTSKIPELGEKQAKIIASYILTYFEENSSKKKEIIDDFLGIVKLWKAGEKPDLYPNVAEYIVQNFTEKPEITPRKQAIMNALRNNNVRCDTNQLQNIAYYILKNCVECQSPQGSLRIQNNSEQLQNSYSHILSSADSNASAVVQEESESESPHTIDMPQNDNIVVEQRSRHRTENPPSQNGGSNFALKRPSFDAVSNDVQQVASAKKRKTLDAREFENRIRQWRDTYLKENTINSSSSATPSFTILSLQQQQANLNELLRHNYSDDSVETLKTKINDCYDKLNDIHREKKERKKDCHIKMCLQCVSIGNLYDAARSKPGNEYRQITIMRKNLDGKEERIPEDFLKKMLRVFKLAQEDKYQWIIVSGISSSELYNNLRLVRIICDKIQDEESNGCNDSNIARGPHEFQVFSNEENMEIN